VVVAGLGAPFGWLWSRFAPHVELVQTQYGPYPLQPEPEGYWADDGWFILMSLGLGVILAVAAWLLLRRYRGPLLLAALVVGSVAASVLAAWLGNKIGWAHYIDQAEHAPVDTHIFRPVKVRAGSASLAFGFLPWVRGTMLIQALTAAAVYTALAGFHASPTLRYDNMPPEYLVPPAPALPGGYPPPDGGYPDGRSETGLGYPSAGPGYSTGEPGSDGAPGHPGAGSGYSAGAVGYPDAGSGLPPAAGEPPWTEPGYTAHQAGYEHSIVREQSQPGYPPAPGDRP
jgi:hypothetical protein